VRERTVVGLLAALWRFSVNQPALAQRYECKADLVVGYAFDETTRSWTVKQFQPPVQKYVVRRLTSQEMQPPINIKGATSGEFEGHERSSLVQCPETKTNIYGDGLRCGGMGLNFVLNARAGRYQKYYAGGYIHGHDDNDDTPSIEIGRCEEVPDR
jgi:hypothetical protein